MAVNKVEFGDQVVMDITDSTVSPEKLLSGETAYDRSGAKITGSLVTKDISIETKRSTGENVATISLDNTDYDIYALSEEEVADFLSGDQEVEGNPVTLKTLIGGNAKACSVDLLPIQDLHGYDNPWVGGAGKNKLVTTLANIKSINAPGVWTDNVYVFHGVTFTVLLDNANNVIGIKANGTASGNADFYIQNSFNATSNMILNGCPSGGSSSTYALRGTGGTIDTGSGGNISSGTTLNIYIRINDTYTANNLIFQPMISTDGGSFAPYSNICPISGRTEVNVTRTGKNMLDINAYEDKHGYYNVNGQFSTSSSYNLYTVKVKSETTYTISGNFAGIITYWDKDLAFLSGVNQGSGFSKTFTTPENCEYIRKSILISSIDGTQMLELGPTATTYEPYQGETVTVQLGQTVYGGTLDVTNGKLTVTRKYVKVKLSEAGSTTQGTACDRYNFGNVFTSNEVLNSGNGNNNNSISSHIAEYKYNTQDNVHFYFSQTGIVLFVPIGTPTTTEIEFCGTLTTLIEITLTAEQISLLKGNNVLTTDGDNIDITWQNIPDIEDITPIKPLDYSTSEQITGQKWIDGSDIYRRTFTGTISSGATEIADFTDLQPIACNGWFMDTSGLGMALGYFPNSTSWASALHIDSNHKLILFTESALAAGTYYVTVDYIKTT